MLPDSPALPLLLFTLACGWTAPFTPDERPPDGTSEQATRTIPKLGAPGGGPLQPLPLDPKVPRVPPALPAPLQPDTDPVLAAPESQAVEPESDTDTGTPESPPLPLVPGQHVVGSFGPDVTPPTYALYLPGQSFVRAVLVPPLGTAARLEIVETRSGRSYASIASSAEGGPRIWTGWLPEGRFTVRVEPTVPLTRPGRFQLGVERLDPFLIPDDQEPNDSVAWERRLPVDGWVRGVTHPQDDPRDVWRLPEITEPTPIVVEVRDASGGTDRVSVLGADGQTPVPGAVWSDETHRLSVELPPGPGPSLVVEGRGRYAVQVRGLPDLEPRDHASSVRLTAEPTPVPIAAESSEEQRLVVPVTLANPTEDDLEITFRHRSDHAAVEVVELAPWSLPAGKEAMLDVPIRIAPGVAPGRDIWVSLAADVEGSRPDTAHIRLRPTCGAPLGSPTPHRPLGPLEGASNVASAAAGGSIDEPALQALIDGEATGAALPVPVAFTLDLAGDDPVEVIGVLPEPDLLVHPIELIVAVSTDGESFRDVAQDFVRPGTRPRPIALESPTLATHVRLQTPARPGLPENPLRLAELHVLARIEGGTPATPLVRPETASEPLCPPADPDATPSVEDTDG